MPLQFDPTPQTQPVAPEQTAEQPAVPSKLPKRPELADKFLRDDAAKFLAKLVETLFDGEKLKREREFSPEQRQELERQAKALFGLPPEAPVSIDVRAGGPSLRRLASVKQNNRLGRWVFEQIL